MSDATKTCPEPRGTGDLYLLDGKALSASYSFDLWWVGGHKFHDVRDRLTLLAREPEVGPVVLAALRWQVSEHEYDDSPLVAAVRAAKENAR